TLRTPRREARCQARCPAHTVVSDDGECVAARGAAPGSFRRRAFPPADGRGARLPLRCASEIRRDALRISARRAALPVPGIQQLDLRRRANAGAVGRCSRRTEAGDRNARCGPARYTHATFTNIRPAPGGRYTC